MIAGGHIWVIAEFQSTKFAIIAITAAMGAFQIEIDERFISIRRVIQNLVV